MLFALGYGLLVTSALFLDYTSRRPRHDADLAERYFMTSLAKYDNDLRGLITRQISASIVAFSALFVLWALVPEVMRKLKQTAREAG